MRGDELARIKRDSKVRLGLLHRQYELTIENCNVCPVRNKTGTAHCKGCETFKELKGIGKSLMKDTAKYNKKKKPLVTPSKKMEYGEMFLYVDKFLTVERYFELQEDGMFDKEIAASIKVSYTSFKNWKRSRGLTRKRKVTTDD